MSAARPQFSIDDAFELSLEDAGPGPEFSGVARFGPLHFERRARFEVADEDKQSRLRYQGFQPNVHPQLPVVLQHHQQQHPAILPCLLQLDATPFDPEEPPGSAGLLPTPAAGAGADPDRRGTGGGPLARCLQRHLLRARLPAVGPGSLPRDLHLLRRQGPPGLPVLLPALFREVSRGRTSRGDPASPASGPRGRSSAPPRSGFLISREGLQDPRAPPAPSKFAQEVCPLPRPGKLVPRLFCALTYSRALGLLRCCFVLIKECTSLQERP
ncbi:transmembrane protein 134 isoform X1 [Lynx canadensis]|uniref:transmembrane protein 134 isoform X1 n=1 Tax=Lynx canadensis TaxID=61383 RepID=UPI0011B0EB73|nr:transmembrane protein 134 isoform X1 [Lynx canadensis]